MLRPLKSDVRPAYVDAKGDPKVSTDNQGSTLSRKQKGELGLQAAIQAIPSIGGSLATLYFGSKQERRFNRLISFYHELANELSDLREQIASIDQHNQEALEAIIEDLNEKVEAEHLAEKRRLLKNYLKSTLFYPITDDYDERKFFLETLASMTLLESQILARLYQDRAEIIFQDLRPKGVDPHALRGAIGRLESYGFALLAPPGNPGDPVLLGKQDDYQRQGVGLTDFGRKFCEFCISEQGGSNNANALDPQS